MKVATRAPNVARMEPCDGLVKLALVKLLGNCKLANEAALRKGLT
jgi:hypothetical protein